MSVINHSAKYLSGILIRKLRFIFARISHFSLLLHEHFWFYKTQNTHSLVEITAHTIRVIYDARNFRISTCICGYTECIRSSVT